MSSSYRSEFPTFPAADIPAILQGADWDDVSWHNDAMPFIVHRETGIGVWTDRSDPAEREHNGPRFLAVALAHDPACGWQHDISGDAELFACETVEELEVRLAYHFAWIRGESE